MPDDHQAWWQSTLSAVPLCVVASTIWDLPYFLVSPFRPVALEVFGLTNKEAGIILTIFGLTSLVFYVLGGPLADTFPTSSLMSVGAIVTGLGGFYLATIPSFHALCVLSFAWSFSTVLIYWSAYVKAVRTWGGPDAQIWSWACLVSSRRLVEGVKQVLLASIFTHLMHKLPAKIALQAIIQMSSVITILSGVFVFLVPTLSDSALRHDESSWNGIGNGSGNVLGSLTVWLMALILLSIYACSNLFDYFPQFAMHGFHISQVKAVWIGTIGPWVDPFVVLAVGWYAARINCTAVCATCLAIIFAIFSAMGFIVPHSLRIFLCCVVLTNAAGAAAKGVFWAILQEAQVPISVTGAVVGAVSLVGYSSDAFSPVLFGYLMDSNPGFRGDQRCMLVGAAFALMGLIAIMSLMPQLRANLEATVSQKLDPVFETTPADVLSSRGVDTVNDYGTVNTSKHD